jgi:hypothetical protein
MLASFAFFLAQRERASAVFSFLVDFFLFGVELANFPHMRVVGPACPSGLTIVAL